MIRMGITVDIDSNSGFCAGVIKAIRNAETFLDASTQGEKLYSLGAIVHNEPELARLERKGLVTIDKDDLTEISDASGKTLLIRAHGEPPQTYRTAESLGFKVIDCTCPVVLKLQKDIREAYARQKASGRDGQILIFGKIGHAEVLGLVGQADGDALVIENMSMLEESISSGKIDLSKPVEIFSQTTKSPAEYASICARLEEMMAHENELSVEHFKGRGLLSVHDTICLQVANRHSRLSRFASEHDVIVFVSDKASSNGKVLCDLCKSMNIRTYHIAKAEEIKKEWFRKDDKVGVCGATSTPKWLLEKVAAEIENFC
ncbi:MAG: 4-hydroxy-3-methylbut-2-enyl diphosphate reductase [Bacteroidales bacterium]|nr:4-hydroxy-3-methylbut-2-enyl diphosphate reductase [Bacteroidales bacterium]